jgi:hypothetical protein
LEVDVLVVVVVLPDELVVDGGVVPVVSLGADSMVKLKVAVPVPVLLLAVRPISIGVVLAEVGVPEITPVLVSILRPDGKPVAENAVGSPVPTVS